MLPNARYTVAGIGTAILMSACTSSGALSPPPTADHYQADIRRTSFGVAHITAGDYGGLGYGEGFAAAEDHVCNIAFGIVGARGERALYFGPGENNRNVIADITNRALGIRDFARDALEQQSTEVKDWLAGYAAGYNRYLRDTGRDGITSWCRGASWVRNISAEDVFARMASIVQTVPNLAQHVVAAQPPADANGTDNAILASAARMPVNAEAFQQVGRGSNGWAIGSELSETGRGLLMANPHYPWTGPDRFWEKHLVIPGRLDIYGGGLLGIPGVLIGFNSDVAWTHTVSKSSRLTLYELSLVPGQPTHYLHDGKPRAMTAREISVPVLSGPGQPVTETHTVWFSHHGPILTMPGLEWSETRAFAISDANAKNSLTLQQWKAMSEARDMDQFIAAHRRWNAMPWVNTVATSADGRAIYMDGSTAANLSEDALDSWQRRLDADPLAGKLYRQFNLPLLDGSDSRFESQPHADSAVPGATPFAAKPMQERSDYVFNANDSYWLSNVAAPLTGYSPLYGEEATARSLRTRMNAQTLTAPGRDQYAGVDGKFSIKELETALLSNASLSARLLQEQLLEACDQRPGSGTDNVDDKDRLDRACAVIAGFDGHFDLDSRGAVLFREWITAYDLAQTRSADELFAVPFSAADPVGTPHTLANAHLAVARLSQAAQVLERAGLALDSSLRDTQFSYHGNGKLPVHGGNSHEGVVNLMMSSAEEDFAFPLHTRPVEGSAFLTNQGYKAAHGSSFILAVSYTESGPKAEAMMAYAQSGNPTSLHSLDQTLLFANKQWRTVSYTAADIDREAVSSITLSEPR